MRRFGVADLEDELIASLQARLEGDPVDHARFVGPPVDIRGLGLLRLGRLLAPMRTAAWQRASLGFHPFRNCKAISRRPRPGSRHTKVIDSHTSRRPAHTSQRITSSARTRTDDGIVSPSALAVFKLTTN